MVSRCWCMVSRLGSMIGRLILWVNSFSFIRNISNITIFISGVGYHLNATIRKINSVWARNFVTRSFLTVSVFRLGVIIFNCVCKSILRCSRVFCVFSRCMVGRCRSFVCWCRCFVDWGRSWGSISRCRISRCRCDICWCTISRCRCSMHSMRSMTNMSSMWGMGCMS